MRVAISTVGKFHSFDLARQLQRQDALAGIWSGYPSQKLRGEGLPPGLVHSVAFWNLLAHAGHRLGSSRRIDDELNWRSAEAIDRAAAAHLPQDLDAFVGLSSAGLAAGRAAKARGAVYVCDRGSTHIRFQEEGMREEYRMYGQEFSGTNPKVVEKEEREYAEADAILVPTRYVANTFVARGIPAERMRLAPYGVQLDAFYPEGERATDAFEVLHVGALSIRKGIKYLLEAFDRLDHPRKRLTLVGSPSAETADLVAKAVARGDVEATGPVSRDEVRRHMGRAHALVLASVEEGLALVQAQALACGLPVVASPPTGCEDLFTDGVEGFIVPPRDPGAIADRLQRLADEPDLRARMSVAAIARVQGLGGWDHYGERVMGHLAALVEGKAGRATAPANPA